MQRQELRVLAHARPGALLDDFCGAGVQYRSTPERKPLVSGLADEVMHEAEVTWIVRHHKLGQVLPARGPLLLRRTLCAEHGVEQLDIDGHPEHRRGAQQTS